MLKKLLLCFGLLMSVPALTSAAFSLSSDDEVEDEFVGFGDIQPDRLNPNFTVDFSPEELAQLRGETSADDAGFADTLQSMGRSLYKTTRNVAAPQYSKQYKNNPTLGYAHGATHWLMGISVFTGLYAFKQAFKTAQAEVLAELKEADKTVSKFELHKATAARVWRNFRSTKLTDQKLLVGSGACIALALAAKALALLKPTWVGRSAAQGNGTETFEQATVMPTDRTPTEDLDEDLTWNLFGDIRDDY